MTTVTRPLPTVLQTASEYVIRLSYLAGHVEPNHVLVDGSDEDGSPITVVYDDSTGDLTAELSTHPENPPYDMLEGAADELGLTLTDSGDTFREWTGDADPVLGIAVTLVLYLPDGGPSLARRLRGKASGLAALAAAAACGAAVAVAARRAVVR